jgi:hypothetical protein
MGLKDSFLGSISTPKKKERKEEKEKKENEEE